MKRNFLFAAFFIFAIYLLYSCKTDTDNDELPSSNSSTSINTSSSSENDVLESTQKIYSYSYYFRIDGYYIRYDGVHYLVHLGTLDDVKTVIKYYYPNCFDVHVYNREDTPKGLPYLRGTWKSYIDSDVLRNGPFS